MAKVPVPTDAEFRRQADERDAPFLLVQELEVELLPGPSGTVLLKLAPQKNRGSGHYLLSLPAVNLLQRELRKAVKAHLRSAERTETE